ncbi:MAG: hypothetical protein A4E48_01360 [Methanosaeta sp. PtaU1.Bin060]|nr:MAG: hypothetical protein A4E48_01360 [Methanosaeta sp. PtaU1.Bin060]
MENRLVYNPVGLLFTLLLAFLLFVVVGFLFLDLARTAFTLIGFTWSEALLVLLLSLLGSGINIPIKTMKCNTPMVSERYVRAFGITYRIPVVENRDCSTILAVNVGGAVIPIVISALLLYEFPAALKYAIAGILFVALITNRIARPIKGLGIVTPALLPPLAAALGAIILVYFLNAPHQFIFLIAYVGGTLGTLIGADVLNLNKIKDMGAPIASIGGAGTFDGVFLSGLIAVLLV